MWNHAKNLQNLLISANYPTLAAGGCVRDYLLGKEAKDIDLATTALPHEALKILRSEGVLCIETGLQHGTITAVIDGHHFEMTTLRTDKNCFGRKAEVEFIRSFAEDAKRRDFTINALFMDLNNNQIFDYVGGQEDLKKRLLRFVGNPVDRIKEDFLRILRFYRFASQLQFHLDQEGSLKAQQFLPYLAYLSPERVRDELTKLLLGEGVKDVLLNNSALLFTIIPELIPTLHHPQNTIYHHSDVFTHTVEVVNNMRSLQQKELSWSALLHDVAKPFCLTTDAKGQDHFFGHEIEGEKVTDRILTRLRFSNEMIQKIKFLIRYHLFFHQNPGEKAIRKQMALCESQMGSREFIFNLLELNKADNLASNRPIDWEMMKQKVLIIFAKTEEIKFESPLSGHEIMSIIGPTAGEIVGQVKKYLREKVIDGELKANDKQVATQLTIEWFSSHQK